MRALPFTLPLTAFVAFASGALAQAAPPHAKPKPPPYSLPWQLRPAVAGNVVRSDTALALYEDPTTGQSGSTVASMLLASYKVLAGESIAAVTHPRVAMACVGRGSPSSRAPSRRRSRTPPR